MSAQTRTSEPLLLPTPRTLQLGSGAWHWPDVWRVHSAAPALAHPGFARLDRALQRAGCRLAPATTSLAPTQADLRLRRDSSFDVEAYGIEVGFAGVDIWAASEAGEFYALCTLAQLVEQAGWRDDVRQLPYLHVEDAPDFPERGILLDVARDRKPTLETLFAMIERFASWKINRLQLYMEADFAFDDANAVLRERSPYTAAELRALDEYCRARHIELVPNQQSFGHMHHWLRHAPWNAFAEVPEGVEHPFSRTREPFSLACSDSRSYEFLDSLYGQLLPCFASQTLNVGLDETFDLGWGRSKAACEQRGKSRVYLEHLFAVHELAARHGKRIQFWGDIVLEHPELIPELPKDATAMAWGYEADFPFEKQLPAFAECGLAFQVCPGTSSWNSFGGRAQNALGNLKKASREAHAHGATGLLITDWGDRGHLQAFPASFMGFAVGAACAWNVGAGQTIDMEAAREMLDRFVFDDRKREFGRATLALARATDVLGDRCVNGHALFFAVTFAAHAFPHPRIVGVERTGLDAVREHLHDALLDLGRAQSARPDADLLKAELELARDMLLVGEKLLRLRSELPTPNHMTDLARDFIKDLTQVRDAISQRHAELWPLRFRPGGLQASLGWLDFLRAD